MKEFLSDLSLKLRNTATVSPDNTTISQIEKELIQEKKRPVVLCAVTLLLSPTDNHLLLTLILRPTYEGTHSGQIAFAGGKKDANDLSLMHTAIRECKEEIGVQLTENQLLGALSDVYIVPSHSLVTPFVAYLPERPIYVAEEREVAKILEFKLTDFLNPAYQTVQDIKISDNKTWKLPCYQINGHIIWGATARMIQDFTKLLNKEKLKF
jgi:8-oxo-dGTP pyrophosphatase MutT (NUDIX family)